MRLWACLARGRLEIRGWALRGPGAAIGLAQIGLSVMDLSLSSAVLWWLLAAADPHRLRHFPRRVRGRGDRRIVSPRARRVGRFRDGDAC